MRRFYSVIVVFLLIGALAKCGGNMKESPSSTASQQTKQSPSHQPKKEATPPKREQLAQQITNGGGGLGDTAQIFERKYGSDAGDLNFSRFQNDYIHSVFDKNQRAWMVFVQFEATSKQRRSKEEALAVAKELMPKDAKKVKEFKKVEMGFDIIQYESKLLAKVLPKDKFDPEKPGTFIVNLKRATTGDGAFYTNEYFGIVLSTGNNP